VAIGWVHDAARILNNEIGRGVRRRLSGLLGALGRHGNLAGGMEHFWKVLRSYWPGLFHAYDVPDLPRTNNDLEHSFGSHRYHERRGTGRKVASPSLVLRGAIRLAAATRQKTFAGGELVPASVERWLELRKQLDRRRQHRVLRHRFRRNPAAYLANLEQEAVQAVLPGQKNGAPARDAPLLVSNDRDYRLAQGR
jgi:hypothetical protein